MVWSGIAWSEGRVAEDGPESRVVGASTVGQTDFELRRAGYMLFARLLSVAEFAVGLFLRPDLARDG